MNESLINALENGLWALAGGLLVLAGMAWVVLCQNVNERKARKVEHDDYDLL